MLTQTAKQTTVNRKVKIQGIGFHLGQPSNLSICPASADTGIVFERTDFENFRIPALFDNVGHVAYTTALIKDGVMVSTVEHLLSALSGCGVDNAIIQIDAIEVPILDGSARQFVDLIEEAGIVELEAPRQFLRVLKPVEVSQGASRAVLLPADNFSVDCTIDFDHPRIGRQQKILQFENGNYQEQIAAARTFIFQNELNWRRNLGQVRNGTTQTSVILGAHDILNPDGLRFIDEFVRHKMLDLMGDLALIGKRLIGHVKATRSGHSLHNKLIKSLLNKPDTWEVAHLP